MLRAIALVLRGATFFRREKDLLIVLRFIAAAVIALLMGVAFVRAMR
jgi:hypothetical protein